MGLINRYFSGFHLLLPLVDLTIAVLIAGISWWIVDFRDIRAGVYWTRYLLQGGLVGIWFVSIFNYSSFTRSIRPCLEGSGRFAWLLRSGLLVSSWVL